MTRRTGKLPNGMAESLYAENLQKPVMTVRIVIRSRKKGLQNGDNPILL